MSEADTKSSWPQNEMHASWRWSPFSLPFFFLLPPLNTLRQRKTGCLAGPELNFVEVMTKQASTTSWKEPNL